MIESDFQYQKKQDKPIKLTFAPQYLSANQMEEHKIPGELESLEAVEKLIQKFPSALLYFYSNSCAPCLSLRPKVVELVCDQFPKVRIGFVNAEAHPEIAATFNAFSFPTLILFFEGREHYRGSKYVAIPQLADTIRKPYVLLFEA